MKAEYEEDEEPSYKWGIEPPALNEPGLSMRTKCQEDTARLAKEAWSWFKTDCMRAAPVGCKDGV